MSKAISELALDDATFGLLLPLLSENEASVLLCKTPDGDDTIPVPEVPMDSTRFVVVRVDDELEFVASLMEVTLLGLRTSASGPPGVEPTQGCAGLSQLENAILVLSSSLAAFISIVLISSLTALPPIDRSSDERDNLPTDAEPLLEVVVVVLVLFSTVSALDQASMKLKPLGFSDWRVCIGTTRGLSKRGKGFSC